MTLRDKIENIIWDDKDEWQHPHAQACAILALPEIAKVENLMSFTVALQAKLAEVEANHKQMTEVLMAGGRELQARAQTAQAALPRAYQMGLDAAAEDCQTRGDAEAVDYGMRRCTQNYYRARDSIRTLQPPADLAERVKGTDHE